MTKFYFMTAAIALISFAQPLLKGQEQNLHNDHKVFGVNKLPPHADFFAYETSDLANKNELENSTR